MKLYVVKAKQVLTVAPPPQCGMDATVMLPAIIGFGDLFGVLVKLFSGGKMKTENCEGCRRRRYEWNLALPFVKRRSVQFKVYEKTKYLLDFPQTVTVSEDTVAEQGELLGVDNVGRG